jgi:hypothetical protein
MQMISSSVCKFVEEGYAEQMNVATWFRFSVKRGMQNRWPYDF